VLATDPIAPRCDVAVVGAGPAGVAAAITLARAGRSVQMFDKATFPRDKTCGDGLTTLALRELERLGFDPATVPNWCPVDDVVLRSPTGRTVRLELPSEGQYAVTAPRHELDAALVAQARAAGVQVHEGWAFHSLTGDHAPVFVSDTKQVEVAASWVVAADGMWSPVRKSTGTSIDGYRGEWHAFRQYIGNVTGPAAGELIVWFEGDLLPGYAWSFPLPGRRVNFGFGVLRESGRSVQDTGALWRDLLTRPHIVDALGPGCSPEGRHAAWPIPARVDDIALTAGRVLFVGDAAAATDVMTGEGIGQALETGRLAGEAIIAGGDVARTYAAAVRAHLFADHRMSKRLGRVLANERGARGALRIVAHSGTWGRRNFARWMFEDEPRAIAVSPSRWHRQAFKRPGAYVTNGVRHRL
jgi:geranylgeranyl reductase family protein